jgi:hypothetical protein
MRSVRRLGTASSIFVPTLISLLRHRKLKGAAREVLVGYGDPVVDALAHFLADPDEDLWVRRHIPATLARIPCQQSMTRSARCCGRPPTASCATSCLGHRQAAPRAPGPRLRPQGGRGLALREGKRYFESLGLHYNLFVREGLARRDALLARALGDKIARSQQRIYTLLGLLYRWQDIDGGSRWAIDGDAGRSRARSSTSTTCSRAASASGVLPVLEDAPIEEKVRAATCSLGRDRDAEETLLRLINDDDQVVAASAINLVAQQKLWALADDIEHVLAHRDAATGTSSRLPRGRSPTTACPTTVAASCGSNRCRPSRSPSG